MSLDVILVLGLSIGIMIFSAGRGGQPEKIGAAIIALNMIIDLIILEWMGRWDFSAFNSSRFLIDLLELALLVMLALNANRIWPIFSAATQLVAVAGSLAVWGSKGGNQLAYWAVTQLPLIGQLASLALGTFLHQRRLAVIGQYRGWRWA